MANKNDVSLNERKLKIDIVMAADYLTTLQPNGPWVLNAIVPDGPTSGETFTVIEQAQKWILQQNIEGQNIYYQPNPLKHVVDTRASKKDIARIEYLWADTDPNKDETAAAFKARMEPILESFKPAPTFVVDTGNGLQWLWRLQEPVELSNESVIADIEARNKALLIKLKAKPGTQNIDRLLRLPGTINYPNESKRKCGRTVCRADCIVDVKAAHPLRAFPPHQPEKKTEKLTGQRNATVIPPRLITLLHLVNPDPGPFDTRSGALMSFLMGALHAKIPDDAIMNACLDDSYVGNSIYEHINENGGRDYLERQLDRAKEKTVTTPQDGSCYSWDDPDLSLLDDRRGKLPEFPLECLSEQLRSMVEQAACGAGVTCDAVATALFGIAGSLVGTARRIQAKVMKQPFTLWFIAVGLSGEGKTPALNAIKNPLDAVQEQRRTVIEQAHRAHKQRAAKAQALKAAWAQQVKTAYKNHTKPPAMPEEAEEPEPFIAPKLYTTDSTIEQMVILLKARPSGILLLVDELAFLFSNMWRYNQGNDRQFYIMSWDGGAYSVERKGSPPINVTNLLVGIGGGLQPDKLADCFRGAADGMYARFLFTWPRLAAYQPLPQDMPAINERITVMLDRLADLPERQRKNIKLSKQAIEGFEEVRKWVHDKIESHDGRARDWWAKIPAQVLRLAGTLAYLDWALSKPGTEEPTMMTKCYIDDASTLVFDYYWRHAQACLLQIGLTQRHADARRVLRWIQRKNLQQVKREQIRRNVLGRDGDATTAVLHHLSRAGWLRQQVEPSSGGRRKEYYEVNPKLTERN